MNTARSTPNLPSQRQLPPLSRPPSSLSRPSSSASHRTTSRLSHRPSSRHSQRPSTRQSTRLAPLCQNLVTQVAGLTVDVDEAVFGATVDYVVRNVDLSAKQAVSLDMTAVNRRLHGYAEKARIHSEGNIAEALELSCRRLRLHSERPSDLDQEIKFFKLPDHLQLLLSLSSPANHSSIDYAENLLENARNPPKPRTALTWQDILVDEPFEGEHWRGAYGLPPGSVKKTWEDSDGSQESSPPLSPLHETNGLYDDMSSLSHSEPADMDEAPVNAGDEKIAWRYHYLDSLRHREELESLQSRQYWRADWRSDALVDAPFDTGDPSTLGPAIHRALGDDDLLRLVDPEREKYIDEHDAVREVLMAFQGDNNLMFDKEVDADIEVITVTVSPLSPRLRHLTSTSQSGILAQFAETATTLERLRHFTRSVFSQACAFPLQGAMHLPKHTSSRTLEAFAAAVDQRVREFNQWCTKREESLLSAANNEAGTVVSLLSLSRYIRDDFSETYGVLLDIIRQTMEFRASSRSLTPKTPSAFASLLLDKLFGEIQSYHSIGDIVTTKSLMVVFAHSAEPVWSIVGRWLKNGMPTLDGIHAAKLDDEFFIEFNEIDLADPDFWTEGYALRSGSLDDGSENAVLHVPEFLFPVASAILGAGKSVGLLRALENSDVSDYDLWRECPWARIWPSFHCFLKENSVLNWHDPCDNKSGDTPSAELTPGIISSTNLSLLIYDRIAPFCETAGRSIKDVLQNHCGLWAHLESIENLYLMRKGDTMTHLCDVIFARMDSRQGWGDYHFLNTAFRDVALAGSVPWIDTSLVRLSYRGNKEAAIHRSVRGLEGLAFEYGAPFPLTYLFGRRSLQVYNSVFVFLMQIRRAKSLLERILVRGAIGKAAHMVCELKIYYAMRSKLSWFVNALFNHISTNVLHAELLHFHSALKEANSLDKIIQLHENHLKKLEGRCFLQSKTSALRRAVLSIMDMSIHFSDCFAAFAGDTTTLDVSRNALPPTKSRRHRSRRVRRQSRNFVAFSQCIPEADDESPDSDSDYDGAVPDQEPTVSYEGASISFAEESFLVRNDKMSSELDGLVRFIRRGVESLASGGGEAASAFEVFAFTLEDWDW